MAQTGFLRFCRVGCRGANGKCSMAWLLTPGNSQGNSLDIRHDVPCSLKAHSHQAKRGSKSENGFYQPQRSWAKVMFLQASVILSTGGVYLSACWDTTSTPPPPRAATPLEQTPPRSTPPRTRSPLEQTPSRADTPPGSRLRDTVNERPVRILLECILVKIHAKKIKE